MVRILWGLLVSQLFYQVELSAMSNQDKLKEVGRIAAEINAKIKAPLWSARQLKEASVKQEKIVLVDVREKEERQVSHIPQSISKEEFLRNQDLYRDHKVISYCTVGYRSGKFTNKLIEQGYKAYNLDGSILTWLHSGGILYDHKNNPTKTVHVYGKTWDLAPNDYVTVYHERSWYQNLLDWFQ